MRIPMRKTLNRTPLYALAIGGVVMLSLTGCANTCANGTAHAELPASGIAGEFCLSCNAGYRLEGSICAANTYTCNNGASAADGTPGADNGDIFCIACDDRYVLENRACRLANYICSKGTAADGNPPSGNSDVTNCVDCYTGYVMDNDACRLPMYICDDGTPAAGAPSGAEDVERCSDCNFGYTLNGTSCDEHNGTGTEDDPFVIRDYDDLYKIRDNLDYHYGLFNDIDASASWNKGISGCIAYNGRNGNDATCTGWEPIGSSRDPFTGTVDGRGFTISKLYIAPINTPVGMFAVIGEHGARNTGIIRSLRLDELYVEGISITGGLVGQVQESGVITGSSVAGAINNIDGDNCGGLVAINFGLITHSYATGSVNSDSNTTGGLVGDNQGIIVSSYARNSVNGVDIVGGLAGRATTTNFSRTETIITSYSSGAVSGTGESIGGLVASNEGNSVIANSFWDTTTSRQMTSGGGDGATGLTTAEMQATSGGRSPAALGTDDWLFEADSYPRLCADDDDDAPCEDKPGVILPGQE